jgi:hypothetical protein
MCVKQDEDMEKVLAKIKAKQQNMKKRSKKEVDQRLKINLDHYSASPLQEQEEDQDDNLGDLMDSDQELDINDEQSEDLTRVKLRPLYGYFRCILFYPPIASKKYLFLHPKDRDCVWWALMSQTIHLRCLTSVM